MSHYYFGLNFAEPGDPRKSILIMNVHPSAFVNLPGPTTTEAFNTGFARCCSRCQMWSMS